MIKVLSLKYNHSCLLQDRSLSQVRLGGDMSINLRSSL